MKLNFQVTLPPEILETAIIEFYKNRGVTIESIQKGSVQILGSGIGATLVIEQKAVK